METAGDFRITHSRKHIHDAGHSHQQEVQQEARPDEQAGTLEAIDFADDAADDIREREYQQATGDIDGPEDSDLFGLEDIGSNQYNR